MYIWWFIFLSRSCTEYPHDNINIKWQPYPHWHGMILHPCQKWIIQVHEGSFTISVNPDNRYKDITIIDALANHYLFIVTFPYSSWMFTAFLLTCLFLCSQTDYTVSKWNQQSTLPSLNIFFFFCTGLRDPIACSILGGGIPTHNSGYESTRLCLY